ncbi:hypothetical protein LTR12_003414 [Friedmanniomyces endolithicus]|nr:hypothetical protein LTR12_003414 [Friedmanniomyces endolithicus]
MSAPIARRAPKASIDLLDPANQAGLQSLLTKIYRKPVELQITKIRRPHLDPSILSAYVSQRLLDRSFGPRRVIRDAAWKAQLPTPRSVVELQQAKQQRGAMVASRTLERSSAFGPLRSSTGLILQKLRLSQVSSVRVQAAGRLSARITANQSQKKIARRGANGKGPGYMIRGFRKGHVGVGMQAGKRRIGAFGVKIALGHSEGRGVYGTERLLESALVAGCAYSPTAAEPQLPP